MAFKVVKTTNTSGKYEFSAVPEAWEANGILSWPNCSQKKMEKMRCNKYSTPQSHWQTYKAVVKLNNIETFGEAVRIEAEFANLPDTDAEAM